MDLRIEQPNLVRRRQATWIEDAFWGPSYALSLTFNDVRPRALFPLYFEKRDRIIRLADDPSVVMSRAAVARYNRDRSYEDPRFSERACERCGKPYRGPALYCSFECAAADA